MECGRICLLLCLVLIAFPVIQVESRSLGRWSQNRSLATKQVNEAVAQKRVSPGLEPESSKTFFNKDYPSDRRPSVDKLHFGYPYPVVQDSGEFDDDYVKDENTDNGQLKAQQEYDRLRHKLKKEKEEAAKALAKRREQEEHLKDAAKRYAAEKSRKDEAEAAKKQVQESKVEIKTDGDTSEANEGKPADWSWNWDWWPLSWPKWDSAESNKANAKEDSSGVRGATKDAERAMDNLDACKKQLEKARAELKELMDDLEQAKAKQTTAEATAAAAAKKQLEAQKAAKGMHDVSSSEEAEYISAKESFDAQQANVDKLQAELDAAAAKVEAYRDAEDKGGGVYNTRDPRKSLTVSASCPRVIIFVLIGMISWQSF